MDTEYEWTRPERARRCRSRALADTVGADDASSSAKARGVSAPCSPELNSPELSCIISTHSIRAPESFADVIGNLRAPGYGPINPRRAPLLRSLQPSRPRMFAAGPPVSWIFVVERPTPGLVPSSPRTILVLEMYTARDTRPHQTVLKLDDE